MKHLIKAFFVIFFVASNAQAGHIYEISGHPDRVKFAASASRNLGHSVDRVVINSSAGPVITVKGPSGTESFTLSLNCIEKMKNSISCEEGQAVGTMCSIQNDSVNSAAFQPVSRPVARAVVQSPVVSTPAPQPVAYEKPRKNLDVIMALAEPGMSDLQESPYSKRVTNWGGRTITGGFIAGGQIGAAHEWGKHYERGQRYRNPDVFNQTIKNGNFDNSSMSTSKATGGNGYGYGGNSVATNNNNVEVTNPQPPVTPPPGDGDAPDDGAGTPGGGDAPDDGAGAPANPGGGAPDGSGGSGT